MQCTCIYGHLVLGGPLLRVHRMLIETRMGIANPGDLHLEHRVKGCGIINVASPARQRKPCLPQSLTSAPYFSAVTGFKIINMPNTDPNHARAGVRSCSS